MDAPMNEGSMAVSSNDKQVGGQHGSELENNNDEEEDAANIAKALRFWKHPSLRDIPVEQKYQYLHENGVTDRQIHKAWDRILDEKSEELPVLLLPTAPAVANGAPPAVPPAVPPAPTGTNPPYLNPHHAHAHTHAQSPYPSQDYPYYPSSAYPPVAYAEEEGPGPFLRGVSLVALGGMVGLTAAAAVRWLNGGDFQLLPPPELRAERKHLQRNSFVPTNDHEEAYDNGDDNGGPIDTIEEEYVSEDQEEDMENGPVLLQDAMQEKLMQDVHSISESIKAHVSLQEKILQKLSNQGTSITNHSMDLLRASNGVGNPNSSCKSGDREDESSRQSSSSSSPSPEAPLLLWAQLLELKCELRTLQHDRTAHQRQTSDSVLENGNGLKDCWENQLAALLPKLDDCIESIKNSCTPPLLVPPNKKSKPLAAPSTTPPSTEASSSCTAPVQAPGTPSKKESSIILKDDSTTSSSTSTDVVPRALSLYQAVQKMAQENDATTLRVGSQILYLYIINLTGNPSNPRYRKIFTTNESFQKVETVIGGKDLLLAVGFEERQGYLEWLEGVTTSNPLSPQVEELAAAKLQEAAAALGILKSGIPSADLTRRALAVVSPPDPNVQPLAPLSSPPLPLPSAPDESALIPSSQSNHDSDTRNDEGGENKGV